MNEYKFTFDSDGLALAVLGQSDEYLQIIEKNTEAEIIARGNELIIKGIKEEVDRVRLILDHLNILAKSKFDINTNVINYAISMSKEEEFDIASQLTDSIYVTSQGKQIKPRTLGQKKYLDAFRSNDIVFGIGPAGTGKTYLAVVMAIKALKNKTVQRIILTRPAVEAGEKLGFLPGDLQDKVDPYLRPLYDALFDMLGSDTAQKYMERGIIEVAPLAYMRGRTLDDAFIILDEAQNTTSSQMKMLLTRIGFGSKAVITGDITQVDLPKEHYSGLIHCQKILNGIDGIKFCYFTHLDIVRHPLVQKIINAYDDVDVK